MCQDPRNTKPENAKNSLNKEFVLMEADALFFIVINL
jgi:hypothetical protein